MSDNRLIWMDLEMTGLNAKTDRILEIATLVTDLDLKVLEIGPELVIQTPKSLLDAMDEWNQTHHGQSGLAAKALASQVTMAEAEAKTLEFLKAWVDPGVAPLCGNSVHQDRRFLEEQMSLVNNFLHYRNIDVTTLKELAKRWYPQLPKMQKKGSHTALDDILESVEELKYYRTHLLKPPSV